MENSGLIIDKPEVPKTFHQLGILVLDGSGSMREKGRGQLTKAQEVEMGIKEMFSRFDASRVKNNFSFSCVKFDVTASMTLAPTPFAELDYYAENFDPLEGKGRGTQIFEGLNEAKKIAEDFLDSAPQDGLKHSVIILLMSDGLCFQPETTRAVAENLKQNPGITIATAYFSKVGEEASDSGDVKNLLQTVASDPVSYYSTIYDGEALRKFFERSISQSSGIGKIN